MSNLSEIRAVTFDAGGTLLQPWPSVGHWYADVAEAHGVRGISAADLDTRFAAAWKASRPFNHGRDEWAALVDRVFVGLCPKPPSETFFDELYQRFAEPPAWKIYDDVLPCLDAIASLGIDLAVVSNWDDRLEPLLGKLGLRKRFAAVVVSFEVGFTKPSPVIFEHAARKLGLPHEHILHVGDHRAEDYEGALAAGFAARLIARGEKSDAIGAINSLLELEDLLAGSTGVR